MKNLINQLKWLFSCSKPVLPHLTFIIITGALRSLSSVYIALITKSLVDAAIASQSNEIKRLMLLLLLVFLLDTIAKTLKKFVYTYANHKL